MNRFLIVAAAGLAIVCNGASGRADRIILERAQWVALRSCAAAGGDAGGHHCRIVHCRY